MITLHKVGSEIENIKSAVIQINQQKASLGIANLGEGGLDESAIDENLQAQRALHPHFDGETDIVGFEDEKRELIECLMDQENKRRSLISIVGMGGLGKTTLTRRIYNNPQVKRHFDTFAWINVSQKYMIVELLKDVMKQVMEIEKESDQKGGTSSTGITLEKLEKMREEEVKQKLYEYLKEHRYLIVLDDVWETEVWSRIDEVFPCHVNNGSRLILTTRHFHVAKSADPLNHPHELRLLTGEESWELFRRKAFPTPELEILGRQLAKRCGGLPLALIVLGGVLLAEDRSHAAWNAVAESLDWESTTDGQRCLDILALSCSALPHHHVKSCFLYIASFPEDSVISASNLIKLWVAEGFVPQKPKQGLEETASGYLNELVRRSLVQVAERNLAHGRVKSIRVHDLVRDMCVSEARRDGFLNIRGVDTDASTFSSAMPVPRVALHHTHAELGASLPNLHTLLGFNIVKQKSLVHGLELLRVLDLKGARWLRRLPKEINKMIHLRYLGLRNTGLHGSLPSSVGSLFNLETLDVRETSIHSVPRTIWRIGSLRHMYIYSQVRENKAPKFIASMKNLRTLKWVRASQSWLESDSTGLSTATNLQKLGIFGICAAQKEALLKFLGKLDHLASFSLDFSGDATIILEELLSALWNHHQLRALTLRGPPSETNISYIPPNLTKLVLHGYYRTSLQEDPMPTLEKLSNLMVLELAPFSYHEKSMSCSAGGFPRLRHLKLCHLEALEEWSVEAGAMPSLTHLAIRSCEELKMLPKGLRHLTTLQELKLIWMPEKFEARVREGEGEDWEQVKHVPSILIFNDEGWV